MTMQPDVLIIGAGIFGVTAALELAHRGYQVVVLDPGPVPNPLAASTDISKVVRLEYGSDETYMIMAERARAGWLRWNDQFDEPLYHEIGLTMLTRQPMTPGGFEYESFQRLSGRGYHPERLSPTELLHRFPAWNSQIYVDGYFNPHSGYAESGRVVAALVEQAMRQGVVFHQSQTVVKLIKEQGQIVGVSTREGNRFNAGQVIVAAGAWTMLLVPELARLMISVGQPVFHLNPADTTLFEPPHFTVFSADVSRTGWYGFPFHPREKVIKITQHGIGLPMHPSDDDRVLGQAEVNNLRAFLMESLPALAKAPLVKAYRCLYCDTLDGHFWIDRHPELAGLTVAAGGSGHAFKFGPLLGQLTADALEGQPNPDLDRFRWRTLSPETINLEGTRFREVSGE